MMMNRRVPLLVVAAVTFLSLTAGFQEAQAGRNMSKQEILEALKPGQWVELEGVAQRDMSVICTKVKFLTGDFLDDDWGVSGIVTNVNPGTQELRILGLSVKAQKDTEYSNGAGTFKGFADLKSGMLVELEGTYLKDGTLLAKEIEDESMKLQEDPDLLSEVSVSGRVHSIDPGRSLVTVMGIKFKLTDLTKGKSNIR